MANRATERKFTLSSFETVSPNERHEKAKTRFFHYLKTFFDEFFSASYVYSLFVIRLRAFAVAYSTFRNVS